MILEFLYKMRQIIILPIIFTLITSCSIKPKLNEANKKLYKLIGKASTTDLQNILSCNYSLSFDKDGTEIWKFTNASNQETMLFFDKNNILKNYLIK